MKPSTFEPSLRNFRPNEAEKSAKVPKSMTVGAVV